MVITQAELCQYYIIFLFQKGAEITKYWYNEVNEYDWNKSEEENFQKDTAHFTQVIWKETREMGIGAAIGSNNIVICCANYYKSGNEVDKYFENVLKPSSHEIDARMNSKSNKYIKIKYLNTSIKLLLNLYQMLKLIVR